MGKDHEASGSGDIATGFVLFEEARKRNVEQNGPGNADLGPHLEINMADTRVQDSTHEVVIEEVARHAVLGAIDHAANVDEGGHGEAPDNGDGHNATEIVDNLGQTEDMSDVENSGDDQSQVPGGEAVAEVLELLFVCVRIRIWLCM